MSTHSQACISCKEACSILKKELQCFGCEHEPPEPLRRNQWFLEVYRSGVLFRTGQDSLDFTAFIQYLRLNDISDKDQLAMIDKAVLIEGINRNKQAEEFEKQKAEADRKRRLAATTTTNSGTIGST